MTISTRRTIVRNDGSAIAPQPCDGCGLLATVRIYFSSRACIDACDACLVELRDVLQRDLGVRDRARELGYATTHPSVFVQSTEELEPLAEKGAAAIAEKPGEKEP